ncbi:type II toxin-antitoxin system mRNA interferase toxin, RelE/StbE family [Microcystis sp. LEGE 08355]|jgi:addiction module RelE/StbE family toxin|uniref:type II toxin-antitoxin system RelE/ParE family toxin n=1 Tax=Microcystis sp. LEGE 08355 TaxID=1828687 RepID=UPI001D15756A|nr:type II toxin-antitoxin system mRNA interferase toxin, RelE/StbE family [Microcystis sp. LEGE 08355]
MDLIWSDGFKRSFKKLIKKNPQLKPQIFDVLRKLAEDPFTLSLKTHRLSGNLEGLWSCTVAYDCRIIFSFSGLGMVRYGGINRLNPYLARDLID